MGPQMHLPLPEWVHLQREGGVTGREWAMALARNAYMAWPCEEDCLGDRPIAPL